MAVAKMDISSNRAGQSDCSESWVTLVGSTISAIPTVMSVWKAKHRGQTSAAERKEVSMELNQVLNWLKHVAQVAVQVGAILGVSAPTFRPYRRIHKAGQGAANCP